MNHQRIQIQGLTGWVILVLGVMVPGLAPGQATGSASLVERELARRAAAASEARQLLGEGDEAYTAARYGDAVTAYREALSLLPEGAPAVVELRRSTQTRLVQAAVERAREWRRLGKVAEARELMDGVLAEDAVPGHPDALAMREQLDDPIRTNPVVTGETAAAIEEVRFLLYRAQGAHDLGNFDKALAVYQDVLRVDPYNQAARRGMQRTIAAQRQYARAAYDQTRGEMLAELDSEWEMPLPPEERIVLGGTSSSGGGVVDYLDKLTTLTIPVVRLEEVTLPEAVEYLRQQSIQLDEATSDPLSRGVNFVIDGGVASAGTPRFSIDLRGVTLARLVEFVAEASGTVVARQPYAVVFRLPGSAAAEGLVTRSYRVPPDFLTSNVFENRGGGVAQADPFAPAPEAGGLQARRLTAEEKLKSLGVPFPEGAAASFISSNSRLSVRNTPVNHSLVEQIIETIANEEPAAVVVEVKIIRTQQSTLEELGFDWILSPFGTSADVFLGGGTIGTGSSRTAADFISPVAGAVLPGIPSTEGQDVSNIITGGLRSGDNVTEDGIDAILNNPNRQAQTRQVAPGVLALTGLFTDGQAQVVLRGFNQSGSAEVMAVPSVTTRSGQQASIAITRELIYPTEYEPPEIPQGVGGGGFGGGGFGGGGGGTVPVTPSMPTAFETRDTGVLFDVLPTASRDKRYVDLSLQPDLVEFDGFVNYGSPIFAPPQPGGLAGTLLNTEPQLLTSNEILMPVFTRLSSETALTVADGATLVFGGLLQDKREIVEDSVPILGDLPLVGRLFQSHSVAPRRTVVVFLVKVRVVDAAGRPFHP